MIGALRRDRAADHAVRAVSVFWLTLPPFWLGLCSHGRGAAGRCPVSGFGDTFSEKVQAIVLPAVTLAIGLAPIQVRALRSSLARVWQSDFVDALRAVGAPAGACLAPRTAERGRARHHRAGRAGQRPAVRHGGDREHVALPGLGEALVTAVAQRDYAVVQGITLVSALVVIGIQLLVDILHAALDPRVTMS